jgi:F420-dependent oxidoreductase-like protein
VEEEREGGTPVKLGLHIVDYTWPGGAPAIRQTLRDVARIAEDGGFDAIAVADHVWQSPYLGGPERSVLEGYSVLSFLAAQTERVRLLTLATAASYRSAGLLAKLVTTLDVLSGGRAELGIGAGHFEEEARGLGLSLPPMKDRFEVLEETILVCLQMWSGDHGDDQPFSGKHVHIERALNLPQSLSRPHPPIMIAGAGERKTLRLVAQHADACGLYPTPDLAHKLDVLRRHCDELGRDFAEIEKTCSYVVPPGTKPRDAINGLRALADLGIQTAYVRFDDLREIQPFADAAAGVVPEMAA